MGLFFFSSRRRHTRSLRDWSSDVCSSDLAEEGRLAATLRVRVLVDDEIRIGAYPYQTRIREDDEDFAVAAGMDLIARLDGRAAGEPQDLAAAEHERVAVRAQHFSGGFRTRGQSKRRGAECDAENPQQTRPARACIP